mgnify:CR=1 FL=1
MFFSLSRFLPSEEISRGLKPVWRCRLSRLCVVGGNQQGLETANNVKMFRVTDISHAAGVQPAVSHESQLIMNINYALSFRHFQRKDNCLLAQVEIDFNRRQNLNAEEHCLDLIVAQEYRQSTTSSSSVQPEG